MTHQLPEVGQRIRLIEMPNDPCPIEPGSLGTVININLDPSDRARHQIGVRWDGSRSLMLVAGVDQFEVVTTHRVVAIEDSIYSRYEALIEAATPDDAAGIMREQIVNGEIVMRQGMCSRDDALPYVTDVIDAEGEECAFGEEHGHDGVVVPDLVKFKAAALDVVRWIHAFDIDTDHVNHTDSGDAWALFNRIRDAIQAHMRKDEIAAQETLNEQHKKELADEDARHEAEMAELDAAQHAMTVSA